MCVCSVNLLGQHVCVAFLTYWKGLSGPQEARTKEPGCLASSAFPG